MNTELTVTEIQSQIIRLEGRPDAMLDKDIAVIYGTETKRVNEAVKRNPERFPEDFIFQMTKDEVGILRSQGATFQWLQDVKYLPHAFTREGCNMLSAVLHTDIAIKRSIQIMRAFSALEQSAEIQHYEPSQMEILFESFLKFKKAKLKTLEYQVSQEIIQQLSQDFQPTQPHRQPDLPIQYSEKEFDIIQLRNKDLSLSQIAKRVYGYSNGNSVKKVSAILRKHKVFLPQSVAKKLEDKAGQPFKPVSPTEESLMNAIYCKICTKKKFCKIKHLSKAFDIDSKEYPEQWQYGFSGQPVCTEFDLNRRR